MTTKQFCRLLAGIQALEAEGLEIEGLLPRLAEVILEVSGVQSVRLRCCRIDEGQLQPERTTPLLCGDAPNHGRQPAPATAGELSFLGHKAVLGDTRETTTTVEYGPKRDEQIELKEGEVFLLVRSCFDRWVVWSAITGDGSLGEDATVAVWKDALHEVARLITHRQEKKRRGRLRREFYRSVADYEPRSPEIDFKYLCDAWLKVSNADWCWLWLHNRLTDTFELSACVSKDPNDRSHHPPRRMALGERGVGDFSRKTRLPTFIPNVETWKEYIGEQEYTVLLRHELKQLEVRSLDHIPFFDPPGPGTEQETQARGLVSLHYGRKHNRVPHLRDSLAVMGGTTGLFLQYVKHREEKEILIELNRIAQKYLAQTNRSPEAARKDYLAELIKLIRARLNVKGVSVFYRMPFRDGVQCIGTTGLRWANESRRIPEEKLGSVVYMPDERYTGKCFAEGKPIVQDFNEDFKTSELAPSQKPRKPEPAIFVPVLDVLNRKKVVGVIRCVEHASPVFGDELCEFDDTEVERLTVIAEQVGPVLQTFEQRMEREQAISIVKHDLEVPYVMMRDTIEEFIDYEFENDPKNTADPKKEGDPKSAAEPKKLSDPQKEYFLRDLEAASRMVASLAETLDPNPLAKLESNPIATYLEGDIIARLKAMISHYARVENEMDIKFDGFREIPRLRIDRALVERAVYNLLVNAIKYGDPGSTITVKAQVGTDAFFVDIANEGIGIRDDEVEDVFSPGFRSAKARERALGLGLGLAIAQDAMKKTGGELRLTTPRDPTKFTLVFPKTLTATSAGD